MNTESNETGKPIRFVKFPFLLKITQSKPVRNNVSSNVMMTKPQIQFPKKCVYCGNECSSVQNTVVTRNKTFKIAMGPNQYINVPVEFSETYPVPVCEEHQDDYKRNSKMRIIGWILGIVIFAVIGLILSPWKSSDDIILFLVWIGLASIGIPFIRRIFPQIAGSVFKHFESAKHWPWIGFQVDFDKKFVALSFYNQSFAQEFVDINRSANHTVEYM